MKIRQGFVSNSSTSSFICQACRASEAGSDCCSMSEYGFYECVNGHEICIECIQQFDPEFEGGEISEKTCPVCQFITLKSDDIVKYLIKKTKISKETVLAEVKKTNQNRTRIYDEEYLRYLAQHDLIDSDEESLISELTNTFKTYENFRKFINN